MKYNKIIILIIFLIIITTIFILKDKYFSSQINQFPLIETMGEWTQYENKEIGFSFSYPNEWYPYNEESDYALISVSPLSPTDPKVASDAGLLSAFNVGILKEESIEKYIQPIKENSLFEPFTVSEIELNNGTIIPVITYFNPIGTYQTESFVRLDDGTILRIWFSASDKIYTQILRSFQ
ncbi:hypothetical protein L6261_04250 [Candidatus Parcubacteria bacterium]|nr:hypothetical protein [Candidatus Parcubacteria bacterium]